MVSGVLEGMQRETNPLRGLSASVERTTGRASCFPPDLVFPNGRGVGLRIGSLDTSNAMNRRDFVTLDETLQPSR
jgi:hypothetical protein